MAISSISELNKELAVALKDWIVENEHIDTGDMFRSVKFNCIDSDNGVKVKLSSKHYIKYLQDGKFISDFFKSKEFKTLVSSYTRSKIMKKIWEQRKMNI